MNKYICEICGRFVSGDWAIRTPHLSYHLSCTLREFNDNVKIQRRQQSRQDRTGV